MNKLEAYKQLVDGKSIHHVDFMFNCIISLNHEGVVISTGVDGSTSYIHLNNAPVNGWRVWEEKPKPEFKPFQQVLVRSDERQNWEAQIFSHMTNERDGYSEGYLFTCAGDTHKYCIPFKGNEHLVGTSDSPQSS